MDPNRRDLLRGAVASAAATVVTGAPWVAHAQKPETLKILAGFPPGSTVDVFTRLVAEKLTGAYATSVIVDNRAGAGGLLAPAALKREKPDGTTIMMSPMPILSVYPFTYGKLPYDPVADFAPLTRGVVYDRAFGVGPMVPAEVRTVPEFCAWARRNPQQASFGSPAAGSPLHFTGVMIGRAQGVPLQHVPYRGSIAGMPDLIEGRLAAFISPLGDLHKFHLQGKLRVLATSGSQRSPFTPDVATFTEQGLTGLGTPEAYCFFGPAGLAPDLVARLNDALRRALLEPSVATALAPVCMTPAPSTPEELAGELKASMAFWGPVVKSIGFKADA